VVVIAPPLIMVVPPLLVERLASAAVPPTILLKVVVPLEFAVRAKVPSIVLPKRILPVPELMMVIAVRVTELLKVIASSEVEIIMPRMAGLAIVKLLLKVEAVVIKETPVPPAESVVVPEIAPPVVTLLTVIIPVPEAVIDKPPVVVMKLSSASARLKPAPAVPRKTLTPEFPVMATKPAAFKAALRAMSPALETVREVRGAVSPTNPVKVMVPAPAVRFKSKAPLSFPPKVTPAPTPPTVLSIRLFASKVTPPVPKLIGFPEVVIAPPTLLAALPVKFKPVLNKKVEVPATSPKVTRPLLRKSTFTAKVLPMPVKLMVVAVALVIKALTVTAPVKVADVPLVMVRLLMLTEVPLIVPAPAVSPRLKAAPSRELPKMILLPPESSVVLAERVTASL